MLLSTYNRGQHDYLNINECGHGLGPYYPLLAFGSYQHFTYRGILDNDLEMKGTPSFCNNNTWIDDESELQRVNIDHLHIDSPFIHDSVVVLRFVVKTLKTAESIFRVGIKVEISLQEEILRDIWFPATIVEDLGNNRFLAEYNCSGINDESELQRVNIDHLDIRPLIPQIRVTSFGLLEKVDAFLLFGWWSGVITKKLADSRYVVYFKHTNKVPVSNDAEHDELRETVTLNRTNPLEDTTIGIDKQTHSVTTSMKRSKPKNLGSNDKLIKAYKRLKSGVPSHDLSLSNGDASKEVSNLPVGQTVDKTKKLFRVKRTPAKQDKSVEPKRPMITSARKKGNLSAGSRGPKALLKGDSTLTITPNTVKENHVTKKFPIPVVVGLQCRAMTVTRSQKSKQLTSKSPQNVGEPETPQSGVPLSPKTTGNQDKEIDGDTSTKRKSARTYKRQPTNRKTSLALVIHQNGDASVKKLPNRRRVELTLQQEKSDKPKSLDTVSEDQPLSTWFLATLESAGKKLPESFKSTNCNDQRPSFEKRSSFWETIESMEAFRVIPQNPHFRPLDDLKESVRERHAIYKMVDFSGVFEKISCLRFDHPRVEIDDQLETLLELETHGFDVGPVRNRLMEMLSFKDKEEGHDTRSKKSKDNIRSQRLKIQERNKAIELIDKQVDELLDKRQRLAKGNEESELKIIVWEEEVDESEEAKRECRRKFDELAMAPLLRLVS
ncbi:hypothetical protein L1987_50408 [Smallanthus sonchifolius]|uniref:Uncharacterized protein n=1 Tax=Smallanthus sonchifolius TaxID=185202 RepID=A0ACB9EMI9_9ASTR|nr:hypothetical protein L1987_50408 [Smallanthus sonchifolius]